MSLAFLTSPFYNVSLKRNPGLYFEYLGKISSQVDTFKIHLLINTQDFLLQGEKYENQMRVVEKECYPNNHYCILHLCRLTLLKIKLKTAQDHFEIINDTLP